MAYPAPPGNSGNQEQPGPSQAPPPIDNGNGSSSISFSAIPKLVLVGGLLLVLLLLLANHFPKFTTGFMLLVLAGVVLSHASIITSFFQTNG